MFESDFAKTDYIEKDNVVFHVWKKEAHFDDYRDPVKASLELLREHKDSVFIEIMTAGRFELLAEFFKTSVCKIENALLI